MTRTPLNLNLSFTGFKPKLIFPLYSLKRTKQTRLQQCVTIKVKCLFREKLTFQMPVCLHDLLSTLFVTYRDNFIFSKASKNLRSLNVKFRVNVLTVFKFKVEGLDSGQVATLRPPLSPLNTLGIAPMSFCCLCISIYLIVAM